MMLSKRLALRASEIRVTLSKLAAQDSLSEEQRTETASLRKELVDVETRWQAAQAAEPEPSAAAAPAKQPHPALPQDARLLELRSQAKVSDFLASAANGQALSGPSLEYSQERCGRGGAGNIPWDLLYEQRGATIPTGANERDVILDRRVLRPPLADFFGVSVEQVSAGHQVFARISTGAFPDTTVAREAEVTDTDTILTAVTASPSRIQASYVLSVEDSALLGAVEAVHRSDLLQSIEAGMDAYTVAQLAGSITDPTAASAQATWTDYAFLGSTLMDGLFASRENDIRVAMPLAMYQHAATVFAEEADTTAANVSAIDYLRRTGVQVRATAGLTLASGEGDFLVGRVGRDVPGANLSVWSGGVQVIRDQYSLSKTGQIRLTVVALAGFAVRQPGMYTKDSRKITA